MAARLRYLASYGPVLCGGWGCGSRFDVLRCRLAGLELKSSFTVPVGPICSNNVVGNDALTALASFGIQEMGLGNDLLGFRSHDLEAENYRCRNLEARRQPQEVHSSAKP